MLKVKDYILGFGFAMFWGSACVAGAVAIVVAGVWIVVSLNRLGVL